MKEVKRGQTEIGALIESPLLRRPFHLAYRFDSRFKEYATSNGDPFLVTLVPIASYYGEDIEISVPVTPELLKQIPKVIDQFQAYYPRFNQINVAQDRATLPLQNHINGRRTAAFFSLGVDSTYTLMKNREEIDVLFVMAFEPSVWPQSYINRIDELIQAVLRKLSKTAAVVFVKSNVRKLSDPLLDWPEVYHGSCMAGIANLFARGVRKTFIAGGCTSDPLIARGSTPALDPLWSTSSMKIVHDSPATRLSKIREMAEIPDLVEHLRVCTDRRECPPNCGTCLKCLRTMIALKLAGTLSRCKTLPQEIPTDRVRYLNLSLEARDWWFGFDAVIQALGDSPANAELKSALLEAKSKKEGHFLRAFHAKNSLALRYLRQRNWQAVKPILEEMLAINPYNGDVRYHLGLCALKLDHDPAQAGASFERALEYGFDQVRGNLRVAQCHFLLKRFPKAFAHLTRACFAIRNIPLDRIPDLVRRMVRKFGSRR